MTHIAFEFVSRRLFSKRPPMVQYFDPLRLRFSTDTTLTMQTVSVSGFVLCPQDMYIFFAYFPFRLFFIISLGRFRSAFKTFRDNNKRNTRRVCAIRPFYHIKAPLFELVLCIPAPYILSKPKVHPFGRNSFSSKHKTGTFYNGGDNNTTKQTANKTIKTTPFNSDRYICPNCLRHVQHFFYGSKQFSISRIL